MDELEKCMAGEWYDCHDGIFLEYICYHRYGLVVQDLRTGSCTWEAPMDL